MLKKLIPKSVKSWLKRIIKNRKFKKFEEESKHYECADLVKYFHASGLRRGDAILIHSSLRSLGYIKGGAKTVIEALMQTVGEEGTLLFPTFTIDASMQNTLSNDQYIFDPETSPSTVGSITNAFLKFEGVSRSIHPTHSVAAWGKNATYITSEHYQLESNFGVGTPFGKFLELNGYVMGLGVNYGPITFYHTYEDHNLEKFPEVYYPTKYKSRVKDNGTVVETLTWCHNVAFHQVRIEKVPEIESFIRNYFEDNDHSKRTPCCDGELWLISTQTMIKELDNLYKQGKSIYHVG